MELEFYGNHEPTKTTLSIRLTESAVFLNTGVEQRPTLLRGLLTLHLIKPTKITSIEVELTATASTLWSQGVGARRIEINEEHRAFHASTLYFRANKSHARRTTSIGPGIYYNETGIPDDDSNPAIVAPIHAATNNSNEIGTSQRTGHLSSRPSSPSSPFHSLFLDHRKKRRGSEVDSSQFQRMSLHEPDGGLTALHMQQLAPIPPYSPFAPPGSSHVNENVDLSTHPPTSPLHSPEDLRHSLYSLRISQSRATSPAISTRTRHSVIPEDDVVESELDTNPSTNPSISRLIPTTSSSTTSSPTHPLDSLSASTSRQSSRGRKPFSLSAVSNVIIDAVRSRSPRTSQSREPRDRDRSMDTPARGRMRERRSEFESLNCSGDDDLEKNSRHVTEKGQENVAKMLGDRDNEEKGKAAGENWKEFKKGTYTFPISFSIPGNSPPTMICDHGSVIWQLKASVHRPGMFNAKLTAVREVITVACPSEEVTDDTESIIVERQWEQQLQYLISISGRSFFVGGTMPVTFTLMPMAKINIHRLSVFIEERVDYYTNMQRIARTDPITSFTLLSVKDDDGPILPLQSDDPDALHRSPLYSLIDPGADLSEVTSNLMGPGPWTLRPNLKLPGSCSVMKFTNKNRKSNIIVTHTLKLVIRVERGDDSSIDVKTGKRKMFDIVVQTPVLILSCRCNPEWISLPRYSEVLDGSAAIVPDCPCYVSRLHSFRVHGTTEATTSSRSSDNSCASVAETSLVNPSSVASLRQLHYNEALATSSSLFERLVSGQESVGGEVPPAYEVDSGTGTNVLQYCSM